MAQNIFSTYPYGSHEHQSFSVCIHANWYFSVKKYYRGALQSKLSILTGLQDHTSSIIKHHSTDES